ncbi:MAG: glycosyl hydrolase 115 family protein, partial [Chthoniobacterales bacterium]
MKSRIRLKNVRENASDFPLVYNQRVSDIVVDSSDKKVVQIAANLLANDIEKVSGIKPAISHSLERKNTPTLIIGTLQSPLISALIEDTRYDFSDIDGVWEAFTIYLISDLISDEVPALLIVGSDPRGTAYGVLEISRAIGISPWEWWADVLPSCRKNIILSLEEKITDRPAIPYRGIFINDEDWGLLPWAEKMMDPEVGNIGPKTYTKVFEAMLRLRANTIWPAMHECTTPFFMVHDNADLADDYSIIIGSSHCEPMLRNNLGEWKKSEEEFNYITNRDEVLAYWEERVRERTSGENLFTLGMRGIHDSAMIGSEEQSERIKVIENIFTEQRKLLARYHGKSNPSQVAQMFVPYKEVLADYKGGLEVPDDVTLVWPDDNFGYVRYFATPEERVRSGGLGIYYHLSYLGAPLSWLWFDTQPPAFIWTELTKSYEQGVHKFWIANVGDLKSNEYSTEFFCDLAWSVDRTSPEVAMEFLHHVTARDFGAAYANAVADILARHHMLAFARKPEHLQWHLTGQPYAPTEFTEEEILRRLDAYRLLEEDARKVATKLSPDVRDAFFELIIYPVAATGAANERYFRAELARLQKAVGQEEEADLSFAASEKAEQRIIKLTDYFNNEVADGKWRHIYTAYGMDYPIWKEYQPDRPLPTLDSDAQNRVQPPPRPKKFPPAVVPADVRSGDFIEQEGVVSINAGNFTGRVDAPSGAGWRAISGLGRTGAAVTILPTTAQFSPETAPQLDYRFYATTDGMPVMHIRLLPTHPLIAGRGLRLAIAIDDQTPQFFIV